MQVTRLLFFLQCIGLTVGLTYYAAAIVRRDKPPLYADIYAYDTNTTALRLYANFTYNINDPDVELYFFEIGPVAIVNNNVSTIYFPIQCGTSFKRLLLISFNMTTKTYKQSPWILNNGVFHFLHYDPNRHRLFGLRDVDTLTLITEEYNLTTLEVVKEYTRQDGEKYAFIYGWCSIFDYEENWLVQVRTRFENPSVQAYYVKMDLNLVGKQGDIVTEFRLLPNIHNLCTMTYDIASKTVLVTWQHGSIDKDLVMMYMDPYSAEFQNETLLLETGSGFVIESTKAVYNEKTNLILFIIDKETEARDGNGESWMVIVEFHTMKIIEKKQFNAGGDIEFLEFFL